MWRRRVYYGICRHIPSNGPVKALFVIRFETACWQKRNCVRWYFTAELGILLFLRLIVTASETNKVKSSCWHNQDMPKTLRSITLAGKIIICSLYELIKDFCCWLSNKNEEPEVHRSLSSRRIRFHYSYLSINDHWIPNPWTVNERLFHSLVLKLSIQKGGAAFYAPHTNTYFSDKRRNLFKTLQKFLKWMFLCLFAYGHTCHELLYRPGKTNLVTALTCWKGR